MADEEKRAKPQGKGKRPEAGQAPSQAGGTEKGGRRRRGAEAAAAPEPTPVPQEPEPKVPPRLRIHYRQEIVPALMRELKIDNPMRVPKLDKIVINMALGEARENVKI